MWSKWHYEIFNRLIKDIEHFNMVHFVRLFFIDNTKYTNWKSKCQ